VWRLAVNARPGFLAISSAMASLNLFLRACRWRLLLNAEGDIAISEAFWATAAGYFGNNFLPARAGELVRSGMIASRSDLQNTYVLTTALSERGADAVALSLILAGALLMLPAPPGWLVGAARSFAALAIIAALGIALLPRLEAPGKRLIERVAMPSPLRLRVSTMLEHAASGLRALHDPRRLSKFVGLTTVIWCLDAAGTVIGGLALGLRIPIKAAFLLLASLGLGSALPSTPGYVGIYQFVAVMVLTPFGFSRTDAIAYILIAQVLIYVLIAIWGGLGLWRYHRARPGSHRPLASQPPST
jgi:uncharacterized protein (TIRG00374 family)